MAALVVLLSACLFATVLEVRRLLGEVERLKVYEHRSNANLSRMHLRVSDLLTEVERLKSDELKAVTELMKVAAERDALDRLNEVITNDHIRAVELAYEATNKRIDEGVWNKLHESVAEAARLREELAKLWPQSLASAGAHDDT